jgi:hypothetical protein
LGVYFGRRFGATLKRATPLPHYAVASCPSEDGVNALMSK